MTATIYKNADNTNPAIGVAAVTPNNSTGSEIFFRGERYGYATAA